MMVVMPEYLITTTKQDSSKPRIISEVKKNCLSKLKLSFTTSLQDFGKSKFSGQLLWNIRNSEWVLRTAEVRQGSLILINKETKATELRLPLRELNLRPSNAPRTFCLTEAKGVRLLMFQALTEDEYEKWVRILAVELIRQTPLQNVRFLDILSILRPHDESTLRKGRSEESIMAAEESSWEPLRNRTHQPLKATSKIRIEPKEETPKEPSLENDFKVRKAKIRIQTSVPIIREEPVKKIWLRTRSMNNLTNPEEETQVPKELSDESGISSGDETQFDSTGRNVEEFSFLSVREKKNFFESLNGGPEIKWVESPLMRSNSIGNFKHFLGDRNKLHKRKRTKSLHDLQKIPVREICRLFESGERKCEEDSLAEEPTEKNAMVVLTQRRLQRGEKKLEKLRNQIIEVEDTIKVVAEDMKSIGKNSLKRKEGLEVFAALQRRLDEENSRLERLKEETARVIKGNQRTILKLERSHEKRL